jgi:hypothetical protein
MQPRATDVEHCIKQSNKARVFDFRNRSEAFGEPKRYREIRSKRRAAKAIMIKLPRKKKLPAARVLQQNGMKRRHIIVFTPVSLVFALQMR